VVIVGFAIKRGEQQCSRKAQISIGSSFNHPIINPQQIEELRGQLQQLQEQLDQVNDRLQNA
jgi:hypothetical protein